MDRVPHRAVLEPVSVTFRIVGDPSDDNYVNISNTNARDVLVALKVPNADTGDLCGELPAAVLARLCMRFVNGAEPDLERMPSEPLRDASRSRYVECGRRPGYLHDVAGRLWRLATSAEPGGVVAWE